MKLSKLIYLIMLLISFQACKVKNQGVDNTDSDSNQQSFPTEKEATDKAKADLIKILEMSPDLKLGVKLAELSKAQPSDPLIKRELDFNKLLTADSAADLGSLATTDAISVVPLEDQGNILTVVDLVKTEGGWKIAALGEQKTTSDLNTLRKAIPDSARGEITIFHVPNLEVLVYAVTGPSGSLYYTNYKNQFSIRQGITSSALLEVIRKDAITFEKQFGKELRNKKLVK